MNNTRRMVFRQHDRYGDCWHVQGSCPDQPMGKSYAEHVYGITEPGTYEVTVRKVEPTWPVVVGSTVGAPYCGHCGRGHCREHNGKCMHCGCSLSSEVPQSKVADFLRQEG